MSIGGNLVNEELKRRAGNASTLLDEIAEKQDDLKAIYAAAKADGYDMKAFKQIIKELRKGPEFQQAQLELELVLDTYRKGVNLPTTLEEAQQAVGADARAVPEPKSEKRKRKGATVQ
mgnify:CR=1 FL=1